MDNTFGENIIPENETERLAALEYFDILKELPDTYFTNLAHIIGLTFDVPIALISLVAADQVHFKGNFGMEGVNTADRGHSLCSLAVLDAEPTVFQDALKEPCLLRNPLVAGKFGLRFYAGAPITTKEGFNIGTVCVVDKQPRDFSDKDKKLLQLFAENTMHEIMNRAEIQRGANAGQV